MFFRKKRPVNVELCGFLIDDFLAAHILYQMDRHMDDDEITGEVYKIITGGLFDQYAREGRFAAMNNPYTPYPYIPEALDGFPELGVQFVQNFTGTVKSLFSPIDNEPLNRTCTNETLVYLPVTKPAQGLDPETRDYMVHHIYHKFRSLDINLPEHYDWSKHFVHISGVSNP